MELLLPYPVREPSIPGAVMPSPSKLQTKE